MNLNPIPQNYKNNVNWILGAYEDAGVTFPNGFQKDAIQNSVGARKVNKWNNWKCDISLITTNKGQYVVVEDSGTVGLTGKNRPTEELYELMAKGVELDANERLSRFTSMFNSGGNKTGGGLYGAGKSVYSVASDTYTYYFDSLREDNLYVANVNKMGQVYSVAFENKEAKDFIFENTGLKEKTTVGTRVIIENPKKELVDSIQNRSIISFIQESWWLIMQRLPEDSMISVNKEKVLIPDNIKKGSNVFDLNGTETYSSGYKVKHFGLYVFKDGSNRWNGISYYRKGMKIGEIEIKDIPKNLEEKYWGYVEVDEQWEEDLSKIENKVHFGVSKGKKSTSAYQNLKNYCNNKVKEQLQNWGYIKNKENEDQKLKEELKQIAEDLQNLFDNLGFEDLGKGPQKPDFDVRWKNIKYPVDCSEKVTTNDIISFTVRINSSYSSDKKFEYSLNVINPKTGNFISSIKSDKITINANSTHDIDFNWEINEKTSQRYSENRIILSVKVVNSGKEKRKELPYFYDIDKPDNTRECVNLVLHECIFPRNNSRRINFGEYLSNVSYLIENKRSYPLSYKLNISIHNANDPTCPKLFDITSIEGKIKPFEDEVTMPIEKIFFNEDKYKSYITEGILELRARLIANEDDGLNEKGDKITFYNYKLYLNIDEKNGKNDVFDIQCVNAPEKYERSWHTAGNSRTITINVGHPAYLNVSDYPEFQYSYMREQMLKEYVLLYLSEGKYDMFKYNNQSFSELDPQNAIEIVLEKIESVYYQSLR